jgi:hypothetical protein
MASPPSACYTARVTESFLVLLLRFLASNQELVKSPQSIVNTLIITHLNFDRHQQAPLAAGA